MASTIINHRAIALEYMRVTRADKLIEILGAKLVRERVADPNEFLLAELRRIAEVKANGQQVRLTSSYQSILLCLWHTCTWYTSVLKATLFSEHDIEVMFNVFDITRKGSVRKDQYMKGMITTAFSSPCLSPLLLIHVQWVGLTAIGVRVPRLPVPEGDNIDKSTFMASMWVITCLHVKIDHGILGFSSSHQTLISILRFGEVLLDSY